jgi:endo-1,4-beta-xylanase
MIDRRHLLTGLAALPAIMRTGHAASGRIPYGACVRADILRQEPAYRAALAGYCQTLVAEGAMKWDTLQPARGTWAFTDADEIATFAAKHAIALRGHTLCWYAALPEWAKAMTTTAETELARFTETVMGRYKRQIRSWDVVNEPLDEFAAQGTDLRPSVWLAQMGPGYIKRAFALARSVDPTCELVLNEYGIEAVIAQDQRKRTAFVELVKRLLDDGATIDAIGLQAHLRGELAIDKDGVARMVETFATLGLKIHITELDVTDDKLPADVATRDRLCADRVRAFLGAVFSATRPASITTWGLSDRYTWVPTWFKRKDGLANRPLPLDADYRPKPMMSVIDEFCRQVP